MKLAVYTKDMNNDIELINSIKNYFTNIYTDFFVCTHTPNIILSTHAILQPFYLTFFDGIIVFLNVQDYEEHKDNVIGEKILCSNSVDLDLEDCSILTHEQIKLKK